MTLVELLVVVGIVIIVTAITLPIIKPALKDRKVREGARQLNSFITLARASAMETGRAAGVYLERSANDTNTCFDVYLAQEPLPYMGDTVDFSFATVASTTVVTFDPVVNAQFQLAADANPLAQVAVGDEIRFNFMGPRYIIRAIVDDDTSDSTNAIRVQVSHAEARWLDVPNTPADLFDDTLDYSPRVPVTGSFRYQVFRQPQKSSVKSMTLPNNIAIDLSFSGLGLPVAASGAAAVSGRQFRSTITGARHPVIIMFSPNGNLKRVSFLDPAITAPGANGLYSPEGTVYLLVGRTNQVNDADGLPQLEYSASNTSYNVTLNKNLLDNANMWVTIGHRSGQVITAPNGWPIAAGDLVSTNYFVDMMAAAREFAQSGDAVGGQ